MPPELSDLLAAGADATAGVAGVADGAATASPVELAGADLAESALPAEALPDSPAGLAAAAP